MKSTIIIVALLWASSAQAHCFSIWHYKTPQHCGLFFHPKKYFAQINISNPNSARTVIPPPIDKSAQVKEPDIVLPLMEPFVPAVQGPDRLKGIGMLREYYGSK